jgi:hypothetical protein
MGGNTRAAEAPKNRGTNSLFARSRRYCWFKPMLNTIAQRLLENVGWGIKLRLYVGAGLSTLDLFSDLYARVRAERAQRRRCNCCAFFCSLLSHAPRAGS